MKQKAVQPFKRDEARARERRSWRQVSVGRVSYGVCLHLEREGNLRDEGRGDASLEYCRACAWLVD